MRCLHAARLLIEDAARTLEELQLWGNLLLLRVTRETDGCRGAAAARWFKRLRSFSCRSPSSSGCRPSPGTCQRAHRQSAAPARALPERAGGSPEAQSSGSDAC